MFITASDVSSLDKSRKKTMLMAEAIMVQMIDTALKAGVSLDSLTKDLGRAETLLVRMVLDKPLGSKEYKSMYEIANEFATVLRKVAAAPSSVKEPVEWTVSSVSSSSSSAHALRPVVSFDALGQAVGVEAVLLDQHGYVVDATLHKLSDDGETSESSQIVEVAPGGGHLTIVDLNPVGPGLVESSRRSMSYEQIVERSKVCHMDVAWLPTPPRDLRTTQEFQILMMKNSILMAVAHIATSTHVQLREKPSRSVFVTRHFKKGELVLSPLTLNVKAVQAQEPSPDKSHEIEVACPTGARYYVTPCFAKGWEVPFWYVTTTPEEGEANVVLKHRTLPLAHGPSSLTAQVPVLTNGSALKQGTELVLFREPGVKADKKRQLPLLESSPHAGPKSKAKSR